MKKIIAFIIMSMILGSCSFQMEKRRYLPGYHIAVTAKRLTPFRNHENKSVGVNNKMQVSNNPGKTKERNSTNEKISDLQQQQSQSKESLGEISVVKKSPARVTKSNNSKQVMQPLTANQEAFHSPSDHKPLKEKQPVPRLHSASDNWFLAWSALMLCGLAAAFRPFISYTRKMGYWALTNRKLARGMHFLAHCGLAGTGFYLGQRIFDAGVQSTDVTTYSLTGLATLLMLTYPKRKVKKGFFRNSYVKQKMFSLLMTVTGLIFFVHIGNLFESKNDSATAVNYQYELTDSSRHNENISRSDNSPGEDSRGLKIFFTVLTALISLVLCIAIVGGSCALICSGQGALAAVLLGVGLPGVIIASVFILKSIWKPQTTAVSSQGTI